MSTKTPDPIDKYVGGRVRQARLIIGMSQEKLSGRLNLTFQQVQKYEGGTNRIAASRLLKIARVLGKPVEWFYEGCPGIMAFAADHVDVDPLQQLGTTGQGVDLARAFLAIQDSGLKAAIVAMAEAAAAVTDRKFAKAA